MLLWELEPRAAKMVGWALGSDTGRSNGRALLEAGEGFNCPVCHVDCLDSRRGRTLPAQVDEARNSIRVALNHGLHVAPAQVADPPSEPKFARGPHRPGAIEDTLNVTFDEEMPRDGHAC